ncbi:phage tail assembly protein [Vibrio scophthalmi]|uniref:Phage tail assembly protein n=2 Tax=Vibrio scophthalmi TaxID=45658 RepID=A0A1E3WEU4_9VIBR|nr:phage tail assembly protein [Vibrio scophthalmi]EGU38661.1 putative phage tail protein [Vibrio scophthalmi LMG 19158]MCY9805316.1 phage tail assembly protein [Vibrio scophthalmi]ODS04321.1 hypothetical protein VSF3289_03452 [Vibrio scophthalmi]
MTNPIKDKGQTKVVTLAEPIEKEVKGEMVTIEKVELTKPHSGHLRGVNLNDICQADFDAGKTVIPRISELDERDMLNLDPANWAPLLTALATFFVNTGR